MFLSSMVHIESLSIFQVFVSEVDVACVLNHFDQNGTGAIYVSLNTQSISS